MKRLTILATALLVATGVQAQQLYKYVDKDGKTVYSDQPPPNSDSKQLSIGSRPAAPAAATAGNAKSAVERDKELEKDRKEAREKQEKANKAAQKADEADKACLAAKSAYQTYADGGRIHRYNDKGERVFLGDAELEVERERARREMEEACKKS